MENIQIGNNRRERIEETINFHLLDDETKEQLDEVAAQAKLQATIIQQQQAGSRNQPAQAIVSEVGDIPEDELERVDANTFRPTENSTTAQVIRYLALKAELQNCKVSIAQQKPGFFSPSGERLPSHWSVVIIIDPSTLSHHHNHSH